MKKELKESESLANEALNLYETRDYNVNMKSDLDELMKNHFENV